MARQSDDTDPRAPTAKGLAAAAANARLIQLGAEKREEIGRVLLLDRDRVVIGRSADAALVTFDAAASRQHAAIERKDGIYRLVDLDSRNGVVLNDDRVKSAELRDGDRILIGGATLLRFTTGAHELDGFAPVLEPDRDATWTFQLESRQFHWSEKLGKVLQTEALSGQRSELLVVHDDDRPRVEAAFQRSKTTGEPFSEELRLSVGPQLWRWVLLRGQLFKSAGGAPERISGTATDVNDRKRRELELGRMALIFECLSDGVFLTDGSLRVVDLNTSAERMFKLDKAQSTGVNLFELVGASSPAELQNVAASQMRAAGRWTTELHIAHTGHDVPFEVVGFPLRHDDDVLGSAFLFRDLTERRQLQAQVAFYDRMSSLGTLSAGVAHEINNPLTYVSNNLQHVMVRLADLELPGKDETLEALRDALEGTRRIAGIVRDLKAFSRDDVAPKPVPTNLGRALEAAFKLTQKLVSTHGRLITQFPDELPFVVATESRLAQVFVNLLINAAQAIPDDRVGGAEIRVAVRVEAEHVEIDVCDNGVGMKPDVLVRAFDPFFTTKPVGVGTGLGLSICHGLVTGFGGELTARSEYGRGSTFTVRLVRASPSAVVREELRGAAPKRRARVLAIDEEPLILRALARILGPHEVVTCGSVDEALAELQAGSFDVVLCDLMLPGRTGMDFYELVKLRHPQLLPYIVFVTGGAFTKAARDFLASVPNPKVNKPIDTAELSRVIHERLLLRSRAAPPTLELKLGAGRDRSG